MRFILILIVFFLFYVKSLYLRQNQQKSSNIPPIIHLHIEEPNSEPDETRRLAEESRYERERIRQLEQKEELDKQGFQQIVNMQNEQIEQLSLLAQMTAQMTAEKIQSQ